MCSLQLSDLIGARSIGNSRGAELGEAGVAIGNAEIVNKKKRNVIELRMFNLRCADP